MRHSRRSSSVRRHRLSRRNREASWDEFFRQLTIDIKIALSIFTLICGLISLSIGCARKKRIGKLERKDIFAWPYARRSREAMLRLTGENYTHVSGNLRHISHILRAITYLSGSDDKTKRTRWRSKTNLSHQSSLSLSPTRRFRISSSVLKDEIIVW